MLGIAVDAVALIIILKTFIDEDVGFGAALLISLVASIGTGLLAFGLALYFGFLGVIAAAVIASLILGVVVSAMFGSEIKRSFLIGGIFTAVHIGFGVAWQLLFQ